MRLDPVRVIHIPATIFPFLDRGPDMSGEMSDCSAVVMAKSGLDLRETIFNVELGQLNS